MSIFRHRAIADNFATDMSGCGEAAVGKPPPPPSWPAEPIGTKLNAAAPITIELFLDLICPFSMKVTRST